MSYESTREAIEAELLKSRALSYKRSVLAIGVVLCAVYLLSQIEFKDLSFFGLKFRDGMSQRTAVLSVLWLLLLYNAASFAYHAWWDFRVWRDNLTAKTQEDRPPKYFPELRMFFGLQPRKLEAAATALGIAHVERWRCAYENGKISWIPVPPEPVEMEARFRFVLDKKLVQRIRERVWSFVALDVVMPAVPLVLATLLGLWEVSRPVLAAALRLVGG